MTNKDMRLVYQNMSQVYQLILNHLMIDYLVIIHAKMLVIRLISICRIAKEKMYNS